MRDDIPQPAPAPAENSDGCILSAPNVRTRKNHLARRPLLSVRSEDPDVWLIWPAAVLDAVMVPA